MPPQLEGRVFSRLQQFATLPEELQNEVKALELHLTEQQAEVFGPHHANLIKTVRSVRAKPLLEKITAWLKATDAPPAVPSTTTTTTTTEDQPNQLESNQPAEAAPAAESAAPVPAPIEATLPAVDAAPTPEPESKPADADNEAEARYLARAKQLLEGLVLHGFITLNKEHEKLPSATNTPGSLVFKDSELFVPVATAIADNNGPSVTVWQFVDGAVFAGFVKRKAGFLAPLTQGKDAYLVANAMLKTVTFFETDVGRAPVAQFEAATTNVAFDKSHFVHGIKLWNETAVELINVGTKLEREALIHTLVSLGLQYREEPTLDVAKITSIYELKDVDIDGNEVLLEQFKGKVLLVVNVSSQCGLTPTNYPELAALDAKYKEQGLQVLAFPCNQFGGQEPGSHEEIKTFVQQFNVAFPLFAKRDVNGVETRPLFSFLKSKLAGPEGDTYIKWNFTKFLVDRNGVPVKRFGPMELPLSFESEIVTLLFQQPAPEAVETRAEAPTTDAPTTEVPATDAPTTDAPTTDAPTTDAPTTDAPTIEAPTTETTAVFTNAQSETATSTTTTTTTPTTAEVKTEAAPTTETTATKTDGKAIETVVTKVATLSVENHPVEETTTTTTTTTTEAQCKPQTLQQESTVVVQGFTPGNEPAP